MATILGVSDGELIRTSWGDSVADELNGNVVKRTANQTMSGTLTAANLFVTGAQSVTAGAVARRDYVDTALGGRVDVDGDTMTGSLTVGGNPSTLAGTAIGNEGTIITHVTAVAGGTNATANVYLDRTGSSAGQPAAVGSSYVVFLRHGINIGSIRTTSAPGILYGETSDYRQKDVLGEVDDPLGVIQSLQARHLRWKESGVEFDGFIAHEVQAVVPAAVVGAKDAVLPANHPIDPGGIDAQQLDASKLVPYLVGAIQVLAARVEALEAA